MTKKTLITSRSQNYSNIPETSKKKEEQNRFVQFNLVTFSSDHLTKIHVSSL